MSDAASKDAPTKGAPTKDAPSEIEWQQLWFGLRARTWSSLALVGIESADLAVDAATRLATVAERDERIAVDVVSALGMPFEGTMGLARRCQSDAGAALTLIACESPARNVAAMPLLQAASGVVIVVSLGARLDEVRRAVDLVGRDRVVATVTVG